MAERNINVNMMTKNEIQVGYIFFSAITQSGGKLQQKTQEKTDGGKQNQHLKPS